eukprot:TRINITY_DN8106_c0_g1_i3.p1 TRINITY_DN8106_c0_g1~~TRINITY_DN8106_c0_g1_i3.p1  ORF type:complete len:454 (+),score=67.05 TRINITY_DN8106_c0_g1_i3:2-1363(+)
MFPSPLSTHKNQTKVMKGPPSALPLRAPRWALLALLLIALAAVRPAQGAYYSGSFAADKPWTFFHKFCFSNMDSGDGNITFTITHTNPNLQIMLYLGINEDGSWDNAYDNRDKLTCQELVDLHRGGSAGIQNVVSGVESQFRVHQATRAYFWYVVLADCSSTRIDVSHYDMRFTNPGGYWEREISYDEFDVPQMYIAFFLLYVILISLHCWGVWKLIKVESWHPLVRILTGAITLESCAVLFEMIHYLIYLRDGVGAPGLQGVAEFMGMASEIVLMFLCILVAKGWAITTLLLTDRNLIIVVMVLFVISYLGLFVWDYVWKDPSTIYFFESIPGIILICMRVLFTGWFLWCIRQTVNFESLPDKKKFYFVFGFCFLLWLLLLPIAVCISLAISPWVRFKIIRGLSLSIDSTAFISFTVLFWPYLVSKYFNVSSSPTLLSGIDRDAPSYGGEGL